MKDGQERVKWESHFPCPISDWDMMKAGGNGKDIEWDREMLANKEERAKRDVLGLFLVQ